MCCGGAGPWSGTPPLWISAPHLRKQRFDPEEAEDPSSARSVLRGCQARSCGEGTCWRFRGGSPQSSMAGRGSSCGFSLRGGAGRGQDRGEGALCGSAHPLARTPLPCRALASELWPGAGLRLQRLSPGSE